VRWGTHAAIQQRGVCHADGTEIMQVWRCGTTDGHLLLLLLLMYAVMSSPAAAFI
jgi:hypothetical protein